jgi:dTDP-glucose 4,6-dehydratase
MSERIFVLGSNSFSGATFCAALAESGRDVIAASRSPEPHVALLPYKWGDAAGRVDFHQIDINQDLDRLDALMKRERPTHVVNFAAQSMVGESWIHPDHWMMTNVVSTVRLHELLRRYDFLEKYVHVTTPEVYGSTEGWVSENTPFNPSTPYAVSRAAGDMSLKTYFQQYSFPVVFTRAANVYGPGQALYRIIPATILSVRQNRKLQLHGGGQSVRIFIHMRDVADATLRATLAGKPGETYHISGYEAISIRGLVEMILARLSKKFEDCVEIVGERPGKDTAYRLDSRKIRIDLGWRDEISLEQGVEETIAWVDRFADSLAELPTHYLHKP